MKLSRAISDSDTLRKEMLFNDSIRGWTVRRPFLLDEVESHGKTNDEDPVPKRLLQIHL